MRLALIFLAFAVTACDPAEAVHKTYQTQKARISVSTFAEGLEHPWGLAFLPDGRLLVTERSGRLRLVSQKGEISEPLKGVPQVVARGQGGLLDVAIDPDFAKNRFVYLSFSEASAEDEDINSTAVARGMLSADNSSLTGLKVIYSQQPKVESNLHFGSRLVFDGKGHLFITQGERSKVEYRGQAQSLDSGLGKIVRLYPDGSIPPDNPFVGRKDARPEIWTYGHRNVQGAALNPATGVLWTAEHGPRGGDEINIEKPGRNYGWPVVSYGVNYDGTAVGTGKSSAPGMEEPLRYWVPSISPSGMAFYTSDTISGWKGNLFLGALSGSKLVRLELDGDKIKSQEDLLADLGLRIRAVKQGSDGALYLLTDESDGEILKLDASP